MRLAVLTAVSFLSASTFAQPATPPPSDAQKSSISAGLLSVPLTVREQYLGRSGAKTVVKFVLEVSKADLRNSVGLNATPRVYSFFITGDVKKPDGGALEGFRVPIDIDLSNVDVSKPVSATFLRALPPGPLVVKLGLEGVTGKAIGVKEVSLVVPAMPSDFAAEDAGKDATGLPSAAAVILESENREVVPPNAAGSLKILAPSKEVPIGLIRIDCEVRPPVTRVEFWLEEKKLLVRNRPPYSVELDLGKIPRKQTLKALGFDAKGNFIDADAWAINERDARLAVRILELPKSSNAPATSEVELKVAVQSIAGGVARSLKLFLDDQLVKEWTNPPFVTSVPSERLKRATLLRATAVDDEGKEFSDIKLLKGESRFVSRVEVNLVELNVSVVDAQGVFAKGLTKSDFTVLEDGQVQDVSGFEFAESQPLSLGIVIDGSGSMKDAMPLVHQAASEFVEKLIGPKDQGFVMEFREGPALLASMTRKKGDLVRAIAETRASGGTALYDSVVMALYQFRSIPGKKAIVVLTDGKDNHSWSDYETLRRYTRTAGIPIYFIGLDISILDVGLKGKMKELTADTGAEAFFVNNAKGLPEIYRKIEVELRSQYFLSYHTNSKKPEDEFRTVEVRLGKPGLRARTIRGYFP